MYHRLAALNALGAAFITIAVSLTTTATLVLRLHQYAASAFTRSAYALTFTLNLQIQKTLKVSSFQLGSLTYVVSFITWKSSHVTSVLDVDFVPAPKMDGAIKTKDTRVGNDPKGWIKRKEKKPNDACNLPGSNYQNFLHSKKKPPVEDSNTGNGIVN